MKKTMLAFIAFVSLAAAAAKIIPALAASRIEPIEALERNSNSRAEYTAAIREDLHHAKSVSP